jgi:hypothetical protein
MKIIGYAKIFISKFFKKSSSCDNSFESIQAYPFNCHIETYLNTRQNFIKQLESISKSLNISSSTLHLSVHYFDTINHSTPISESSKFNLLLICLSLAIKFNEDLIELNYSDLQDLSPLLTKSHILHIEFFILEKLNWKLMVSTTYDQIHEIWSKFFKSIKILNDSLKLSNLILSLNEFYNEEPKILACTCIAFTLKKIGTSQYWPDQVEIYTKVSKTSLKILEFEKMLNEVVSKNNSVY